MNSHGDYQIYPFAAEFYDEAYSNAQLLVPRDDVKFYVSLAIEVGEPVLEVACGTGRVLIPTAREGIEIVGLDISRPMLDKCRVKLEKESDEVRSRVRLVEADMRSFELDKKFKLATIPFRPFQHLIAVDDQMSCLHEIKRHLEDGGILALDVFNPSIPMLANESRREEWGEEPEFTMPDGTKVTRRMRVPNVDFIAQVTDCELIFYVVRPDGRKERLVQDFKMRWLFRYELEHLLIRAGFEILHEYCDFDKSPLGKKYPGDLIFVARKG
jgi:ubiquinone/menaquinone biosynthesis C-methylase UbiE